MVIFLILAGLLHQPPTPGLDDVQQRVSSLPKPELRVEFSACPDYLGLDGRDIPIGWSSRTALESVRSRLEASLSSPAFGPPDAVTNDFAQVGRELSNEDQALRSMLNSDPDDFLVRVVLCRSVLLAHAHIEIGLEDGAFLRTLEEGASTEIGALTLLVMHQTDRELVRRAANAAASSQQIHSRVRAGLLDYSAQLTLGRQIYGSYLSCINGVAVADPPLLDPEDVDHRRAQLGLARTFAEAAREEAAWLCVED